MQRLDSRRRLQVTRERTGCIYRRKLPRTVSIINRHRAPASQGDANMRVAWRKRRQVCAHEGPARLIPSMRQGEFANQKAAGHEKAKWRANDAMKRASRMRWSECGRPSISSKGPCICAQGRHVETSQICPFDGQPQSEARDSKTKR